MSVNFEKPPGAPGCWGTKYQDGDKECGQCASVDSCRPVMMARLTSPQPDRVSLPMHRPMYSPPPPPPVPTAFAAPPVARPVQQATVPLPPKPYYQATTTVVPMPKPQTPAPQTPGSPGYFQQSTGWSVPNHSNPNPLVPLHRPGSQGQVYYLMQFPGESVIVRVVKNVLLRVAEALFGELLQFVRQWAWPPALA